MNNKYRVWCEQLGRMISGDDLKLDQAHGSLNEFFSNPDYIFMQYTGLNDKNGVEIYAGDIVSIDNRETFIAFEWAGCGWFFEHGSPLSDYSNIDVVGNLYDNPELLPENTKEST